VLPRRQEDGVVAVVVAFVPPMFVVSADFGAKILLSTRPNKAPSTPAARSGSSPPMSARATGCGGPGSRTAVGLPAGAPWRDWRRDSADSLSVIAVKLSRL
jgi:hypothetical protein